MKRSSVLSRVFFRRAAVRSLVPDLKLVLVVLTIGCESHVGVYRPAGLGEDTGLDSSALAGALDDLARRSHILPDAATGEIFIVDWFRDNSFSTAARRGQARDDFAQIESEKLRQAVLKAIDQNPSCGLTAADFSQSLNNHAVASQGEGKGKVKEEAAAPRADARGPGTAAANQDLKRRHPNRIGGMECWYPSEDPKARDIVTNHDPKTIQAAASAVRRRPNSAGNPTSPVPELVLAEIERQQHERKAAAQKASEQAAQDAIYTPKISPEDREKAAAWQAKLEKNRQQETTR